jgi:hypothetical protein
MTSAFLEFSKSRGNDLSTAVPEFGFPGLKAGDRWCLCAPRWQEALEAGQTPRVVLRASHEGALAYCSLADLKRFAIDLAWLRSIDHALSGMPSVYSIMSFWVRLETSKAPLTNEVRRSWPVMLSLIYLGVCLILLGQLKLI